MKILFTANRFPYPPFRGDKLKIFHLAQQLSKKHELHLITFLQDKGDRQHIEKLTPYFSKIHLIDLPKSKSLFSVATGIFKSKPFQVSYFHSSKMKAKIEELHQKEHFDGIHVQHLRMAQYWKDFKDIPRIIDLPDAYSLYWQRRVETFTGLKKTLARWEQKRVFNYEKKVLKEYNQTLVCSQEDAKYLRTHHQLDTVAVLPNGVDMKTFSEANHNYNLNRTLLFTGNMDYAPNVDAVTYFVRDIFPILKGKFPDLKFIIAGQNPVKKVLALAGESVEITGFVENFSTLYQKAAIVVAPLRFGAGTQNKVLEAMSMGVPVVSGKIGFHGLNIQSGEGVFLALEKDAFIKQCTELLKNNKLRQETGLKGKSVIKQRFSWPVVSKKLEHYFFKFNK